VIDLLQIGAALALIAIGALSLWSTHVAARSSADAHHIRRSPRR